MRFIDIPILNLKRRFLRTVLTIIGIAVAVAGFIALVGMSRGLEKAWINSLGDRGTHMLVTRKGVVELLTASIEESVGEDIQNVEGIRSVAGELVDLAELDGHPVFIAGWAAQSYLWNTLHLVEGSLPNPTISNEIVVGYACAQTFGIKPGESIRLRNHDFNVTGIFRQDGLMTNGTIVFLLPTLQDLMRKPETVTVFNLLVDQPNDSEWVTSLQKNLGESFEDLMFIETSEIAESNHIMRLFRVMAWGTASIALVIALVLILNTLLMAVTERTREIGILSAIGWSSKRILIMIMLEGILLSVIGSIAGSFLGIYGLEYLATLPQMQGFLEPEVTNRMIFEVCGTTCILGILGSLYPAYRAIQINTVDAIRM